MIPTNQIIKGDCLEQLKLLPENSVDAIITDPPYGIGFMGKEWDNFKPSTIKEGMIKDKRQKTQIASTRISNIAGTYDLSLTGNQKFQKWVEQVARECLRVLKPGGFLLSFAGTRTYHRLACGIEDAGFEIRDCIQWLYGSGFPKSLNIGKHVDKIQGNEREVVGESRNGSNSLMGGLSGNETKTIQEITKGNSEWEGWGTALKPANEPIVVARKPLSEKNVALNVLKWGTGGINIDACRIGSDVIKSLGGRKNNLAGDNRNEKGAGMFACGKPNLNTEHKGRFPANIILDEEAGKMLDEQSGVLGSKSLAIRKTPNSGGTGNCYTTSNDNVGNVVSRGDVGGASRFFYCAKASKSERNFGCPEYEIDNTDKYNGKFPCSKADRFKNNHPTVKPIKLMEYLIKLVSKEGAVILDPFLGSGTTAIASLKLGRKFIGIEKEEEYIKIAQARIKPFMEQKTL